MLFLTSFSTSLFGLSSKPSTTVTLVKELAFQIFAFRNQKSSNHYLRWLISMSL